MTPDELADWMARVARGELLDPESSRRIFAYLDKDPSRLRIARRFPSEALWAGKSGTMSGIRNDAGILRTRKGRFVLVVLTAETKAVGLGPDHPAVLAIADLAKAIVDTWSARAAGYHGEAGVTWSRVASSVLSPEWSGTCRLEISRLGPGRKGG